LAVLFLPRAGKGGWEGFYKIPPIPPFLKGGKGRDYKRKKGTAPCFRDSPLFMGKEEKEPFILEVGKAF